MSIYIYPTDTLWGIGCDAFSQKDVERIAHIKQTSQGKPLSILFSDFEQLSNYFSFSMPITMTWVEKFFEMESTLLIPVEFARHSIPDFITCGSPFIGVRLVRNDATIKICSEVGGPVTTSSLNISGAPPINDLEGAKNFAKKFVDDAQIINANIQPSGKASSLIKMTNKPEFLRRGRFADEIQKHIGLLTA